MLYKVKAKIKHDKMKDFFAALINGKIESQQPDGTTMLKAMKNALMLDEQTISWYEVCYCPTPFKHERETVYDTYLYDFETTLVYEVKDDIVGKSFWDYLEKMYYDDTYSY
jgi:hypothetical protein